MPLPRKDCSKIYQDKLVIRMITKDKRMFSQGKRLPVGVANTGARRRAVRAYVKGSMVSAVKVLREELGWGIRESLDYMEKLRGGAGHWVKVD